MRRLIFSLLVTLVSAQALALTPFTAVYDAKISGLKASNQITLSAADDTGRLEYRSVSKARGFARLLKSDPIVEYTRFEEVDGEFRPIEYHYLFNSKGSKRNAWIIFNREDSVAQSLYKTVTVELDIQTDHVDRLLEQLVFRADLVAGTNAEKYPYIDRNAPREAVYEKLGTETVRTKAGSFDTVKYRRQRVGSRRSAIIWFAPELEFLPVRIQHFKDDKSTGFAVLKRYALGSVTPR
ncbi:MAG: DUF3108 domain-containing protein [Woeseia sp.]